MSDYNGEVAAITGTAGGISRELARSSAVKGMKKCRPSLTPCLKNVFLEYLQKAPAPEAARCFFTVVTVGHRGGGSDLLGQQ